MTTHQAGDARDAAAAIIVLARAYKRAAEEGRLAAIIEECDEELPERSSDAWFTEADELEHKLFDAIDRLDAMDGRTKDR